MVRSRLDWRQSHSSKYGRSMLQGQWLIFVPPASSRRSPSPVKSIVIAKLPCLAHAIRKIIPCRPTQFCAHTRRRLLSQQIGPAQFLSVSTSHAPTHHDESRVFAACPPLRCPLFSYSYELLFPQVLCFDNHLRCPRVWGSHRSERRSDLPNSNLETL